MSRSCKFLSAGLLILSLMGASRAWAADADKASVSKYNSYVVTTPPAASAILSKQNSYAVTMPPATSALITKSVTYVVTTTKYPSVFIFEE